MSDWAEEVAMAETAAERRQAAEAVAEGRFDVVHAEAKAAGDVQNALKTEEFRAWMAARNATDAAWGAWSVKMDEKPPA
jgi:hypothetical protein